MKPYILSRRFNKVELSIFPRTNSFLAARKIYFSYPVTDNRFNSINLVIMDEEAIYRRHRSNSERNAGVHPVRRRAGHRAIRYDQFAGRSAINNRMIDLPMMQQTSSRTITRNDLMVSSSLGIARTLDTHNTYIRLNFSSRHVITGVWRQSRIWWSPPPSLSFSFVDLSINFHYTLRCRRRRGI